MVLKQIWVTFMRINGWLLLKRSGHTHVWYIIHFYAHYYPWFKISGVRKKMEVKTLTTFCLTEISEVKDWERFNVWETPGDFHCWRPSSYSSIIPELTFCCRAWDCSTAVRKPLGKVKPESQNSLGGWVVSAHSWNWLTRWPRSLVHAARGFSDG